MFFFRAIVSRSSPTSHNQLIIDFNLPAPRIMNPTEKKEASKLFFRLSHFSFASNSITAKQSGRSRSLFLAASKRKFSAPLVFLSTLGLECFNKEHNWCKMKVSKFIVLLRFVSSPLLCLTSSVRFNSSLFSCCSPYTFGFSYSRWDCWITKLIYKICLITFLSFFASFGASGLKLILIEI